MSQTNKKTTPQPVDHYAEIGRRAHQLMWDRKMTQTEFGDRTGMDQSSVAKRFRGKLGWSAIHLLDAAEVLETTVGYLVGETDVSTITDPNLPPKDYSAVSSDNVTHVDFTTRKSHKAG